MINSNQKTHPKVSKHLVNNLQGLTSLRGICKLYGCKVKTTDASTPTYWSHESTIYLIKEQINFNPIYSVRAFAHELAHHIQHQVLNKLNISYDNTHFKDVLLFERTADRLGYFICKEHFPSFKLHHAHFKAYTSKAGIDMLREWHNNE